MLSRKIRLKLFDLRENTLHHWFSLVNLSRTKRIVSFDSVTVGGQMVDLEARAPSLHEAELRSECTRVRVLIGVIGTLLVLVLIRGVIESPAFQRTRLRTP